MDFARRQHQIPRVALLPLLLLSLGCWPYCSLGGGDSSSSVTAPGDDGVFVKAEASSGGTPAQIVLERATRKVGGGGEVTYVIPKSLTTQELRLEVGEGTTNAALLLAKHDEASSYDEFGLDVSPDGKTVAYKLGTQPWRFVYVLSPDLVVHGPRESASLDWTKTPGLADDFIEVFDAQSLRLDGMYSFEKKTPMLKWLRAHSGEQAVVKALFDLVPKDDSQWVSNLNVLTDDGREQLRAMLRSAVERGTPHPGYYTCALEIGAVEPTSLTAGVVRRATHALLDHESTVANNGVDLAEYLRVHASHDAKDAAQIGCKLLGMKSVGAPNGLPYALDLGRPLQLMASAVLANHTTRCPAVEQLPDARCTACSGECSAGTLAEAVRTTLITPLKIPEPGKTLENLPALARLTAAAQASSSPDAAACR